MFTVLAALLAIAGLIRISPVNLRSVAPIVTAIALASATFYFVSLSGMVRIGVITDSLPWVQAIGANFDMRIDGLSSMFAILICGIGSLVFLYSYKYMAQYERLNGFYAVLTLFTFAMLGLVLSDNMIAFFVFWELTSLSSFFLVGFKDSSAEVRENARTALFLTVGGGLFLLVGIAIVAGIGMQQGLSLEEAMLFSNISTQTTEHALFPLLIVCFGLAIATKSAQFPFHFWLPGAMSGPTPVSSFLHSATMVKAGVYLLARLHPSFGHDPYWSTLFVGLGAITMALGGFMAASHRDIKKILAYSTISVLGILVMLLGIGTEMAIKAFVVFLVAHALYKASLFQIIGNIDYVTGSRDITRLGGLAKIMPLTAAAALLAALSKAGSPPLFGFFGKEMAYLAQVQLGYSGLALTLLAVATNILLVGLALSILFRPFWQQGDASIEIKRSLPLSMQVGPFLMATLGLATGVIPGFFDAHFGSPMATAVLGNSVEMKLKLWHGFNFESILVVVLSLITLGAGFYAAVQYRRLEEFTSRIVAKIQAHGPNAIYTAGLAKMLAGASFLEQRFQNGQLFFYIRVTLVGIVALVLPKVFCVDVVAALLERPQTVVAGFSVFLALATIAVVFGRRPITRMLFAGAVGLTMVMGFMVFGAYDLALTQLMVEALTLIFLVFLISAVKDTRMPRTGGAVPLIIASAMTFIVMAAVLGVPNYYSGDLSQYFVSKSLSEAYGRNVVNVVLVDFRAIDTFGEVVVVGVAGLGVAAIFMQLQKLKEQHRE